LLSEVIQVGDLYTKQAPVISGESKEATKAELAKQLQDLRQEFARKELPY
jgi:hypothetical protein